MRTIIVYKCTKCDYTHEEYDNVKAVWHQGCPRAKNNEIGIAMVPLEESQKSLDQRR